MRTTLDRLVDGFTETAQSACPVDIYVGAYWTFVSVEISGSIRAGIAATSGSSGDHHYNHRPPVRHAGRLSELNAVELLDLARSPFELEASIGFAMMNALLNVARENESPENAADVLIEKGKGKKVAVVGHFPFSDRVREVARQSWILELKPRQGDTPAYRAPEILPRADVIGITGVTLINHTFDPLISMCRDDAFVVVLGGTTPLSPILFDTGIDVIAGTRIVDPEAALRSIREGATFRQIAGRQPVSLFKESRSHPS